jgi:hypothetical protein
MKYQSIILFTSLVAFASFTYANTSNNAHTANLLTDVLRSPLNQPTQKYHGIAVSRLAFLNPKKRNKLIHQAKTHSIDTFVVEFTKNSPKYQQSIDAIKANHLLFVPRIEMFYPGGNKTQLKNPEIWQNRWPKVKQAIEAGADAIQFDYIRYHSKTKAGLENTHDVQTILLWYQNKLATYHMPLQIVVFGITSFKASHSIGQDIKRFAPIVDVLCPTLYPSHFEPYRIHAQNPYQIISKALASIHKRIPLQTKPLLIPYIEVTNYRYTHTKRETITYIKKQIQAIEDGHTNGWYFWSASSRYALLFEALDELHA